MPDRTDPETRWAAIFDVPAIVARQLKAEPLLLTLVGIAALLTVLGVFAPSGAAGYAWVVAALTLAVAVLWAALRIRRAPRSRSGPTPPSVPEGGNLADVGDRASIDEVDMRASRSNVFRSGKRARIRSIEMRAGTPSLTDPPSEGHS